MTKEWRISFWPINDATISEMRRFHAKSMFTLYTMKSDQGEPKIKWNEMRKKRETCMRCCASRINSNNCNFCYFVLRFCFVWLRRSLETHSFNMSPFITRISTVRCHVHIITCSQIYLRINILLLFVVAIFNYRQLKWKLFRFRFRRKETKNDRNTSSTITKKKQKNVCSKRSRRR